MKYSRGKLCVLVLAAGLALVGDVAGQTTPDEHAQHHPQPGAANSAAGGDAGGAAPEGGMGAMMAPKSPSGGCMGGGCGSGAGTTPIYPSLMTLPALTPEKRAELEALASQQTKEGTARLAQGSQSLDRAMQAGDEAAMQQSVGMMHEALNELEAGIAARRVLSEGKAPRNLALDWFKREMSLASPVVHDASRGFLGLSPLHLFTMALLIMFASAMLAMYFFKMRRAAALFGRLKPDAESPPPGSSPPFGGPAGPSTPPGGKDSPSGGSVPPSGASPPPTASPGADASAPPLADKLPTRAPDGQPPLPAAPTPTPGASSAPASTASPAAPLTAKWRGYLHVESIVSETPSVKTYRLRSTCDGALAFTFTPGQFLNVAFGIGGARMNRSYSISSSPNERDHVELSVKREERGAVSRHIHDLIKVGDEIEAGGPVGTFTFTGTEADSIVLISGGVGITPLMSVTRYLSERSWSGDIFFVYACRTPADFIFEKTIAALERLNPRLHVVVTMSKPGPDWKGPRGRISKELLTQAVPNLASRRVHLCGPLAMMDATKALLIELGVSPDRLKTEQFGAVKPPLAPPGTSAKPTAPATGPLVTFSKNNKSAKIGIDQTGEQGATDAGPGQTILELSEELGIGIEFSCRIGTCGVCKVKMTSGEVEMAVQDALDADDKANNIILACQAKPKTDVTVEA
jgi:ferredoxin-NADP reductase